MVAASKNDLKLAWKVEFNTETCSICEVCVRGCPTHALIARTEGSVEQIYFDARLCDGCGGNPFCREHCPENAVAIAQVPAETVPGQPWMLIKGEMVACQSCGALFMPERKLNTLLKKEQITPKAIQRECPACRREHLLDSYLKITGQI